MNLADLTTNKWTETAVTNNCIWESYAKVTTTITGGTNPLVSIGKGIEADIGQIIYKRETIGSDDGSTSAGVNVAYVLTGKTIWRPWDATIYTTTYYSDQNQAESGNNSKYTVIATDGSLTKGTTSWGITTGNTYATGINLAINLLTTTTGDIIDDMVTLGNSYCTTLDTFYRDQPATGTKPYALVEPISIKDSADGSVITMIGKITFYTDAGTSVSGKTYSTLRTALIDEIQKQFDAHESDLGVTSLVFIGTGEKQIGDDFENTMYWKAIYPQT